MKAKDFYLTYISSRNTYCEIGYAFYKNKCRKLKKNCQLHISTCELCK